MGMGIGQPSEITIKRKKRWTIEIFDEKPVFHTIDYVYGAFVLCFFFHDQTGESYPYKNRVLDKATAAILSKEDVPFTVCRWTGTGGLDYSYSTKCGKVLEVSLEGEYVLKLVLSSDCSDFPN